MVVRRKTQKCYCSRAVYSLWSVLDSDDDEDGGTEEDTEEEEEEVVKPTKIKFIKG